MADAQAGVPVLCGQILLWGEVKALMRCQRASDPFAWKSQFKIVTRKCNGDAFGSQLTPRSMVNPVGSVKGQRQSIRSSRSKGDGFQQIGFLKN